LWQSAHRDAKIGRMSFSKTGASAASAAAVRPCAENTLTAKRQIPSARRRWGCMTDRSVEAVVGDVAGPTVFHRPTLMARFVTLYVVRQCYPLRCQFMRRLRDSYSTPRQSEKECRKGSAAGRCPELPKALRVPLAARPDRH
jgi:hypothetical protein